MGRGSVARWGPGRASDSYFVHRIEKRLATHEKPIRTNAYSWKNTVVFPEDGNGNPEQFVRVVDKDLRDHPEELSKSAMSGPRISK
jgi:hypothetical protein